MVWFVKRDSILNNNTVFIWIGERFMIMHELV